MEFALKSAPGTLKEVYRTSEGCIYQCERTCQIMLEFQEDILPFKIPCFFSFRRQVDKINLDEMLLDSSISSDIEILKPCGCDKIFVLTLKEIADLKALLEGSKVMFDLNRILHERLCDTCS